MLSAFGSHPCRDLQICIVLGSTLSTAVVLNEIKWWNFKDHLKGNLVNYYFFNISSYGFTFTKLHHDYSTYSLSFNPSLSFLAALSFNDPTSKIHFLFFSGNGKNLNNSSLVSPWTVYLWIKEHFKELLADAHALIKTVCKMHSAFTAWCTRGKKVNCTCTPSYAGSSWQHHS